MDQIYRTRANRNFCKDQGIRISGPKLGRPGKPEQAKAEISGQYGSNRNRT
ncbi:MAG: transposase [Ruminococcus sp.]|nr:transposase [Ruminococcus sp.]